jgi:hypothetical protein
MSTAGAAGAGAPDPAISTNQAPAETTPDGFVLVPAPPPLTADERKAAAERHRAEAAAQYDNDMAAADHAESHGQSLIASAEAMRAAATETRDAALAYADQMEGGGS